MTKKRQLYERVHNKFNAALGKRMITHHHKGRRVEKVYNAVHHLSNGRLHFGELCLALVFMATTYLFGNGEHLPNNTSLVYPLHQVSSLECRTQEWSVLSDNCKLTLPRIRGADYVTYQNEKVYTDIYTVLRGASYTSGRDQAVGAHYGTDIATAKGTPLYAIADGEVYSAEYNSAYGNVVKIKFKYKGEILYAVYAHMNAYIVKAGDTVKKGQQIGEVGNSGNVSGALGGFHVHFEIDKDASGRPAYVYTNCAELKKGHYEIIQKGYCRVQLFQYTKDPIALLEEANAVYPSLSEPPLPSLPEVSEEDTPTDDHPSPTLPDVSAPDMSGVDIQPLLPEDTTSSLVESNTQVKLDLSKVDLVGKTFLNTWDISLEKHFGEEVAVNDELVITVKIKHKITGEAFHGTLSQPLLLIANNTNVNITPVSTVVISRGEAKITLLPKAKGNTYLAINLGTAKIGGLILSSK